MTTTTISAQYRICATCTYWTGNRAVRGPRGSFVKVNINSSARCAPTGGLPHALTNAKQSCGQHVRWTALHQGRP